MRYEVTFQVGGEQHVDTIDAPDAAAAAAAVKEAHGHTPEMFELIYVHLVADEGQPAEARTAGPLNEPS